MTKSAIKGRADDPRACRGVIRATFLTLPLVFFFALALSPLSANVDNSGNISVQRCEAYANPAVVTGASGFIEAAATAAGVSSGDFVATIAGMTATGLGMNIASDGGVSMGATFSHNINSLLDAGDYTPYENLSQQDQEAWGSQDNYNSAKLNSLMDAFGLGDARDRFYTTGGASFNEDEILILDKLGRIGSNWSIRASNAIDDIRDMFTDKKAVYEYLGKSDYWTCDMSGAPNYPSTFPVNVNVNKTNYGNAKGSYYNSKMYTSRDVYWLAFYVGNQQNVFVAYKFDKSPFGYTTNLSIPYDEARSYTYEENTYYMSKSSGNMGDAITFENLTGSGNVPYADSFDRFIPYILFNMDLSGEPGVDVPDYPTSEIDGETPVYYPEEVTPDTPWQDYTTQPEEPPAPVIRPDNVYNPDNLTGTQEWRDETEDNVMPLQNIKFNKLFPFCLMTDVQDLTEKIEETITPGEQSDYLKIKIPMAYASDGQGGQVSEDVELDGTPLRDLLVMVRPFNQILLLFLMVFSLVMFWKSILTGD